MNEISFSGANEGLQVGISYAPINISAKPLEPLPKPLSTVPFPHDPDFVSRELYFNQLHEKASSPGSRIVLVGLGGVGKTQLAIQYCYWVRQKSPETWVFWIHASNAARCESSLRDLADRVKIPGRQDRNTNIFQLVGNWLQDKSIGKWIIVLDNVDDDELLRPSMINQSLTSDQSNVSTQPLLRYLLTSSNGFTIITSRNKTIALNITGHSNIIEMSPMSKAEAVDLLQKKINIPAERETLVDLVTALEFMPLAIIQAAAYITHRSPGCSVSQYLEEFQKSDHDAIQLLKYEAGLLDRDWEAKNSILFTWQISFEYIRRIQPSAADLLSLMSFFDRQGIQESVLRVRQDRETNKNLRLHKGLRKLLKRFKDLTHSSDKGHTVMNDASVNQRFKEDIIILNDFSLISFGENRQVLMMHRLIQLTVHMWLNSHGELERWKKRFINNLYHEFPTGGYENWERCQPLFPHVKAAMLQRPESRDSLRQWASLLYRGAWYSQERGHIAESKEMALKSREERLASFGARAEETLDSSAMLATVYRLEGMWKEAEQLEVQVMETRKTKLGADHPDTLTSMANLASTYRNQGRWEEAEQLEVQVMEISKTKLGADHPDTLTSMANLASTYQSQGRWEEAEQLKVQVMETSKTKLGADHPDTLTSMANLAFTWKSSGQHTDAIDLLKACVVKQQQILGLSHPRTKSNSNTLLEWETDALDIDT
ncbi:hypothetical protein N7495_002105 [Penicillium taxi]|uniref:uncharacterized protein n=1 Tax=Penicillium taxi TaxID=168475 RepID=UPI002545A4C8|nr:uncharacterized protein N7495_002105 [Penicillium taxi]KAJ5901577.1 hypothetical protein N7495_002105 [Penicillium taxi]